MATVSPFRGILYSERFRTPEVLAPPYDVIDSQKRELLKKQHKNNIVNLILPDSYDGANELLNQWFEQGVLAFDSNCSFYTYTADFEFDGEKKTLRGIVAALKVEPFGKSVKPHEKTLKGPKIDRFNLITKTHAMFCPIMGLYDRSPEIEGVIEESTRAQAIFDARFENINHRLFKIHERDSIETIGQILKDKELIIADGHHRYETALMIKEFFNNMGIKSGGFDYIMALLIDAEAGGLVLSAIHRLIKNLEDFDSFFNKLKNYFNISRENPENADFTMYYNGQFYYLKLKEKKSTGLLESTNSKLFEDYIYKRILKLNDEDIKNEKAAGYAHTVEELKNAVDRGVAKVGFILKPISFRELVKIAQAGLTVPQKSTYFYPKIPSGLVGYHFNSIEGCEDV